MKAVVMCGGIGSRMRPLTEVRPKPLIDVLGIPVLERILRELSQTEEISEVFLSLGYRAQDLISFCESTDYQATLRYREEDKPLGTAGGVKNCIRKSVEPVCVLSGDNLFGFNLKKVLDYHLASGADFTVVGKETEDPREYGTILKDAQGNILAFREKPTWEQTESMLINTGVYIISPEILEMIPEHEFCDFSEHLFPRLLKEHKRFLCYTTKEFWADIGSFPLYSETVRELLSSRNVWIRDGDTLITEDTADENGNALIAPCLIRKDASFGCNNRIGPFSVIGSGASVGSGCFIRNSVLGENVIVEDRSDVIGAVLDDNVRVGANCVLESGVVAAYGCDISKFSRVMSGVKIWPGVRVLPESVLSSDVSCETPQQLEVDLFGVSGKLYSQFTVSDAAKLGQAIASVNHTQRIGVGSDRFNSSEIYKALCAAGIRSCGVICYDFEEIYRAQAYFYSAYCALDAFLYISTSGDTVNVSFFGKNGMPVDAKTARAVNSNFRFSAFSFSPPERSTEVFRMHLLSTAYTAAMQRMLSCSVSGRVITVESDNLCLKNLLTDFLKKSGAGEGGPGLQFLFNETGSELYCIENDKFYSSDRIRAALCELEFAQGKNVIVPEDAPLHLEETAKRYGVHVSRLYENAPGAAVDPQVFLENVWNFDAVFLCVKLLNVLVTAGVTLQSLLASQPGFNLRKKVVEVDCLPSNLRNRIASAGVEREPENGVYYGFNDAKGSVKVRQLGNANRVRILAQAGSMEAAKELTAQIQAKINAADIDNFSKK